MEHTITKDEELLALTSGNLPKERQQVEGNALRVLAHDSAGVGTAGVEVPQQSTVPGLVGFASLLEVVALGIHVVGNEVLNRGLGATVSVGRANGAVLGDRDHVLEAGGIAIDGCRGRKYNVGNVVATHGAEESDAAADIDAVVLEGLLARLADSLVLGKVSECARNRCSARKSHLQGGEVNNTVNGGVLRKDLIESLLVGDVDSIEVGATTAEGLNAVKSDLGRVV